MKNSAIAFIIIVLFAAIAYGVAGSLWQNDRLEREAQLARAQVAIVEAKAEARHQERIDDQRSFMLWTAWLAASKSDICLGAVGAFAMFAGVLVLTGQVEIKIIEKGKNA